MHTVSDRRVEKQRWPQSGPDYWRIGDSTTSGVGSVCVEISDAGLCEMADNDISKQKNDISFGLGELMRQTDKVQQAT